MNVQPNVSFVFHRRKKIGFGTSRESVNEFSDLGELSLFYVSYEVTNN